MRGQLRPRGQDLTYRKPRKFSAKPGAEPSSLTPGLGFLSSTYQPLFHVWYKAGRRAGGSWHCWAPTVCPAWCQALSVHCHLILMSTLEIDIATIPISQVSKLIPEEEAHHQLPKVRLPRTGGKPRPALEGTDPACSAATGLYSS